MEEEERPLLSTGHLGGLATVWQCFVHCPCSLGCPPLGPFTFPDNGDASLEPRKLRGLPGCIDYKLN